MRRKFLSVTAALVLVLASVLPGFIVEAAPVVLTAPLSAVDQARLAEVLYEGLINCEEAISVSEFNIPYDTSLGADDPGIVLLSDLIYSFNDTFYVTGINVELRGYASDYIVYKVSPQYTDEKDVCVAKRLTAIEAANELISDLDGLTDLQIALILHDRLCQLVEYDVESAANRAPEGSDCYTMYGALVNHIAVCEGYTAAYAYMLDQFGIANRKCRSVALTHVWNIVTINGEEYHVDVTHDDPVSDRIGRARHENFLRSSAGIYSTGQYHDGHAADDYDTTPSDTTYDAYFWQNVDTAFQYLNGEFYYINKSTARLNRWTGGETSEELLTIPDKWMADATHYYSGCYANLVSDGKTLIYHNPASIYRYNTVTGESTLLYTPEAEEGNYIYGLRVRGRTLDYLLNTSPNAGGTIASYIFQRIADGDGDGAVTDADRILLSRYLADWEVEIDLSLMDIDGNGAVTAVDRAILARYLAQWGEPYNAYFD